MGNATAKELFESDKRITPLKNIDYGLFLDLLKECETVSFVYDSYQDKGNFYMKKDSGYIMFGKEGKYIAVSADELYDLPFGRMLKENAIGKETVILTNLMNDKDANKINQTSLTEAKKVSTTLQFADLLMKELLKPTDYDTNATWTDLKKQYGEAKKSNSGEGVELVMMKVGILGYTRYFAYYKIEETVGNYLMNKGKSEGAKKPAKISG